MPEYSAPLRVTWELPESTEKLSLYWDRLVEGRGLFAEAHATSGCAKTLISLLEMAKARHGPRLTLVAPFDSLLGLAEGAERELLKSLEAVLVPPYPSAPELKKLADNFGSYRRLARASDRNQSHNAERPVELR